MKTKDPRSALPYYLHRLSSILQRKSDEALQRELEIGFSQAKLMIIASKHPRCEQREMAHHLGQTEASISRQLKIMQDAKLVSVERDKKDNRRRHIKLTAHGEKTLAKAKKVLEAQHSEALKDFTDQEVEQLLEQHKRMIQALCANHKHVD